MITWSPFRTINTPITQPITENYLGKYAYTPIGLFANGEQGAWYDPSDTTTLFQDSAGTIPVTASGQPVGLMLDKSGRGHHATQPTAGSRPIYRRGDSRGVVNLLLNTEALATQSRTVTAVGHTLSFTGTGSITLSGASTAGPLVGTGVNDRVSLTFTPTAGSLTLTVSGSVTKGQLNIGPTALPYQRNDSHLGGVATGASTDLHRLETDGVDDGMATGSIDFTGTDEVSVFAGVRKLSDAAHGSVWELGPNGGISNPGAGVVSLSSAKVEYNLHGTSRWTASTTAVPSGAPWTFISSVAFDLGAAQGAGETPATRLNGAAVATSIDPTFNNAGTGNFGNYPLYLLRRGGTSLPFNGWFYGLAITGRLTTDAETVATERFLAAKSAVVIP